VRDLLDQMDGGMSRMTTSYPEVATAEVAETPTSQEELQRLMQAAAVVA
jgi:hypothetical protein